MYHIYTLLSFVTLLACNEGSGSKESTEVTATTASMAKHRVIFDTDANNELDDQHALAYLLLNGDDFAVRGVTVNATRSGGEVKNHYDEALRVIQLCNLEGKIPLYTGADANFEDIRDSIHLDDFDGHEAVDFIIKEALATKDDSPLILLAVGKLTNVALALMKEPQISSRMKVVWLGSNYPEPGEYNQDSDIPSMNYVLNSYTPFEMVTVRYGKPSGTDAVSLKRTEINERMPGKGPQSSTPVIGRHGQPHSSFGDYSVSLFANYKYDATTRALFDMAAVAIIKEPQWAEVRTHPCPIFKDGAWVERPTNTRTIEIWENFNRDAIIEDLFKTLDSYKLAGTE